MPTSESQSRPENGPDSYFSDTLPASRGQMRTIAVLACQLLNIDPPVSRLDASVIIARLRTAQLDPAVLAKLPKPEDVF